MPDIVDWPSSPAFVPASFSLGLDVAEFVSTGVYTGARTRRSALADRLTAIVTLPPALHPGAVAEREAFMLALRSGGAWLRMALPHRRAPVGNARGALTCAAAAIAGARTIQIAGARADPNMLGTPSFDVDSNSDGRADNWNAYSSGSVSGVTYQLAAGGFFSPWAQQVSTTSLGASSSDQAGIRHDQLVVAPGASYALAVDCKASTTAVDVRVQFDWLTSANVYLSSSLATFAATTDWFRRSVAAAAPATAARVNAYVMMIGRGTVQANAQLWLDNAQLELAAGPTAFSGLPRMAAGDVIGLPNDTLAIVAPPGATGTDAGALTVPLTSPLPRAVAAGAAIAWQQPRGLWELDADAVQLDYSAPVLQAGFALPLRQVVQG